MEPSLQRLGRREWWLWFCALAVTSLSWTVLLLTAFPSLFRNTDHFFQIRSDDARWATFCLLLLFNTWFVYRQRLFRRLRKDLSELSGDREADGRGLYGATRLDAITNVHTQASSETLLGREVARARRQNTALSLIAFHLDDFAKLNEFHGGDAGNLVAKEFVNRLRRASRGSDFIVRLNSDDFLLVLPQCSLAQAKSVTDRLGTLEIKVSKEDVALAYSTGWIDYKAGETPSDLFRRAGDILRLYKQANKANSSTTLLLR